MNGRDYFWCPLCKAFTPDTYTPDDIEDRCPVCGSLRPDDAPELGFDVNPSDTARGYRRVYRVLDGTDARDFVDDRSLAFFVKVEQVSGKVGSRYLVMDEDGVCFALGDAPDPCDSEVVERYCDESFLRFNDNGPTRIRYTRNPGLVGLLNRRPRKNYRFHCRRCGKKVRVEDVGGHLCCRRCGMIFDAVGGVR